MLAKTTNVLTNGINPVVEAPAAISTMLSSAAPQLKNRSGKRSPNWKVLVDLAMSASKTMIRGSRSPSSAKVRP